MSERRYSERYDVFLIVEFRLRNSPDAHVQGVTENISPEGLSFDSSSHNLRVADVLELLLKTPDGQLSLSVPGEIIWKRELWYKCITGIKFRDVDKDTEGKIAELVAAAREKHVASPLGNREEEEPAAVPDPGQESRSQRPSLKDSSNAASAVLESIDKLIDRSESEDKRMVEETGSKKVPEAERKESDDREQHGYGRPMTFYRTPAGDGGRGLKRLFLIALVAVCLIAAVAVLSVKFAPVRQPLTADILKEDSIPSQDAGEVRNESPEQDVSQEGMITPAGPDEGQAISDSKGELPEEAGAAGSGPDTASPAVIQEAEERRPVAAADEIQPDSTQPAGAGLQVPKFQATVIFDKNSDVVNPWFLPEIERISNAMFNYPGTRVMVTGHTDSVGLTSYNIDLSLRRAAAVQNLLVQKGIERSRIETEGLGYSHPAHPNDTEKGRTGNRRVEMTVVPSTPRAGD